MRDIPDIKKKEIISRWLNGDYKDKISAEMEISSTQVTYVINEWKREVGSAIAEAYRGIANSGLATQETMNPTDIIQAFKLMLSLKKFGVEPENFDDFMTRFSKIALSAKIEPEGFASIVNQVLKLAEIDGIEIHQLPAHLEGLQTAKSELQAEIEKLKEKKDSLSQDLSALRTAESPTPTLDSKVISQLVSMSEQIKQFGLSIDDVSAFADMISNAKKYGYNFASIIDFVSSLGSLEQEKNHIKSELERLGGIREDLLEAHRSLEQDLSRQQEMLDPITRLAKMGLELHDFELIIELIHKVAEINKIDDFNVARQKFFEDMRALYSNNKTSGIGHEAADAQQPIKLHEEEIVKSKEQQSKYDKELLDMVERLASKGITEQTLMKCLVVNEIFKLDLDALAEDLKKYSNVRNAAKRLEDRRSKLESDELVLKHKILALEERRQQTAVLLKESVDKVQKVPFGNLGEKELDLAPLIRIAKGERQDAINPEDLNKAILNAIDLISQGLDPESLTKKILDHAKFSLQHEPSMHNSQ